ncbi:MAG: polysaccharide biosynthesis/export family protein, partial [Ghiorsea sp.]|nr:polysaccharide biosynthesis/export family protein [Ghiorsea sp.]
MSIRSLQAVKHSLLLLVAAVSISGCVLSPGMNMQSSQFEVADVGKDDFREGVLIQPINSSLIRKKLSSYQESIQTQLPAILESDMRDYQYKIKPQDVLQVTVWDHPELTTPAGIAVTSANTGNLVRKDGTIFYPYVGVMLVKDKSIEEVRLELTSRLANFIENPQVDVRVSAFRSQIVYVTGQVNSVGALTITDRPLTVIDAIAQAKGMMLDADFQHVTLTRGGITYRLDLFSLYERGMSDLNVLLVAGDVLNVP